MIKLTDLIKELDRPENIYAPGSTPEKTDDDIIQKGFRLKGTTINPETGTSTSTVEYLPKFDQIKKDLGETAKTMRPFKFKTDPSISLVAKKLITALNKAQELTGVLDGLIKAEKGL
jgi:hypothetical protein